MKFKSFLLALGTGATILVSVAIFGFYWIWQQSPLTIIGGGTNKYPQAAIFVPRQAPAMVSLLTNVDRLEALRQLVTPLGKRWEARKELSELKQNLLAGTGVDYQKDIKPWLGDELTLAVTSLDFDRQPENGAQAGYLLAVNTKDAELSKEFLQLAYSEAAIAGTSDLVFETYQGVNLIYKRPLSTDSKNNIASAVVGNFLLLANHPRVLKDAINNAQSTDLNLENAPAYQNALKTIEDPRISLGFVNLPALSAWIAKAPTSESSDISELLTIALSLKQGGLAAQTALTGLAADITLPATLGKPVAALQYLPSQTIFTASGRDLNHFWGEIRSGLAPNSAVSQLLNRLVINLQTPLNIDLARDIFSWVKGEYAVALIASEDKKKFDWLFVAEQNEDTEMGIANLDSLAQKQGLSVGNFNVADTDVTAWTKLITAEKENLVSLNARVKGAHTNSDKYKLLATSIEALSLALRQGEHKLLQTDKFQQGIAALPDENDGYLYVDWEAGEPIIGDRLPLVKVVELSAQPLFNHLRSLTFSSQGTENGIRKATVFFKLVQS
jgi:hypothetical protein